MKLALGLRSFGTFLGMCALHQATVDIHGPNTIFATVEEVCGGGRLARKCEVVSGQLRGRGVAELSYAWSASGNHRGQANVQRTDPAVRGVKGVGRFVMLEYSTADSSCECRRVYGERSVGMCVVVVPMTPSRREEASRTAGNNLEMRFADPQAPPLSLAPTTRKTSISCLKRHARTTQGGNGAINFPCQKRLRLVAKSATCIWAV